ncbi:MAG: hypothetical protein IPN85_12060 [Flavobacteriales bacterium]|nr:hypothetical protein [Flavobacteriales bacterium]MBK9288356.1 hypothetical protein [Flavobacteriales bacterium]
MSGYTPIDCNLYDTYEAWATLRTMLVITHRDDHDVEMKSEGRIVDLRNEVGAEWLVMDNGTRIRLDRVLNVREQSM